MKKSDFFYDLPQELIAQHPAEPRDSSRLMVLDKKTGAVKHDIFHNIAQYIEPGDCLILNDTKVLPARLYGTRVDTGSVVEFLLLNNKGDDIWEVITGPGKKARKGHRFTFHDMLFAEIVDVLPDGNRLAKFTYDGVFFELLDKIGEMPLPHYITEKLENNDRYQTVYARERGSAAAPTAGLHFTPELLDSLREKGVGVGFVTLHVGIGTFRPVSEENIEDHEMHKEWYTVSEETAKEVNAARAEGRRVIAVGTTSVRTLESAGQSGILESGSGWTQLYIYPGYQWHMVDAIVTNFHLPESTLVMMMASFAGREHILAAYEEAVKQKYRFFSFGDAMFLR